MISAQRAQNTNVFKEPGSISEPDVERREVESFCKNCKVQVSSLEQCQS